jgi:hypothetical protein
LGQKRGVHAVSRREVLDVVREHTLQEAHAVRTDRVDEAAEARIEHGAAVTRRTPFVFWISETRRQRLPQEGSDLSPALRQDRCERIDHCAINNKGE